MDNQVPKEEGRYRILGVFKNEEILSKALMEFMETSERGDYIYDGDEIHVNLGDGEFLSIPIPK